MPTYRFDSFSVFLTYAQSDLTTEEIITKLKSFKPLLWARVGHERHADGGTHQHVVARWTGRVSTRSPDAFDIRGKHPEIERIRSIKAALKYCAKDGKFDDHGTIPTGGDSKTGEHPDWVELAGNSSRIEFLKETAKARLPYPYAIEFWNAGQPVTNTIEEGEEYNLEWEDTRLHEQGFHEHESNIIIGPTGCGKTSWACRVAPKPALFISHIDKLRGFRNDYHQSIIFDDMSFSHLHREAQIHLLDKTKDRDIHIRYGTANIPKKTTKFFTANYLPFSNDPAINRRFYAIILN